MTRSDLSIPRPMPEPRREPLPNPQPDQPDDLPDSERIGFDAIPGALADGWRDFRRAPAFGLLFSGFYVAGGLVLATVATASGQDWWLFPFIAGFPLIAPFAAVWL